MSNPMHISSPPRRRSLLLALLALVLAGALVPAWPPASAQPAAPRAGVTATAADGVVRIVSAERFALTIDGAGIAAWYDLAADPGRNLVAAGARLLAHSGPGGAPLAGSARLLAASPLRAQVLVEGPAGSVRYTVWAGGQVAVETSGALTTGAELALDRAAATGAALTQTGAGALLYLGAWTPDDARPGDAGVATTGGPGLASAPALDAANTLRVDAAGARALTVTMPAGVVRQPRIRVAGWPGPQLSVALQGRTLVPGVDYLAEWDPSGGELTLQYLGLLTHGAAARSFTLSAIEQAPTLALEILNSAGTAPRTLAPDGLLRVDANLPSAEGTAPGTPSSRDIFDIPYIQTWPQLRLRATVASPPANLSGVRFTVSGPGFSARVDDTSAADGFTAVVSLPRRAEYAVSATALVGGQPAAPSSTIAKAGYGRVFVAIGDSITAGRWGYFRRPGDSGYPFTAPPAVGGPYPVSADQRNYPQAENTNDDLAAYESTAYQGYQIELNNQLAACLNSPVFVLNSGISGIRTARDGYDSANLGSGRGTGGRRNVLGKAAAYRSQMSQLGAQHVLLQIGTNDASLVASSPTQVSNEPMPASVYRQDLADVLTALRQGNAGLTIWAARLPWRDDKSSNEPEEAREQKRAKVRDFNAEIVSLVGQLGASTPTLLGPDLYTLFDDGVGRGLLVATAPAAVGGQADRLHPSAAGYTAMAGQWASTLCDELPREPDPSATATPTGSPTVTPTATPTASATPRPGPLSERTFLPLLRRGGQ